MTSNLPPQSAGQRWKESSARKIIEWLPQDQTPRGARSPHFWIIAALMAVLTLVYHAGHTPLAQFGGFLACDYPHDIHRTLFLFPVIYAAVAFRRWGALIASFLFLCAVLPRPFLCSPYVAPLLRPIIFVPLTALIGLLTATLINRMEKGEKTHAALKAAYHELREYDQRLKESHEQLKKSEERYRNTLDGMLEGCQIIDFDWRYLYINDAAAKQGRRPKEELLGHTMMEMYSGIEDTDMFTRLRYCMEKRISHNMENLFTFPDGSQGWFELRIQPVPEGIFMLSIDITERKSVEKMLARVIDASSIPAFVVNKQHKVTHWNTAIEALSGIKREKIIGTDEQWKAFYTEKRPVMADLILSGAAKDRVELFYRGKCKKSYLIDGAYEAEDFFPALGKDGKWLHFTASPIRENSGEIIGAIETLEDTTEHKQAEEQLIQAEKLTSLGQMAASIAHEVNNPLAGVLIYTQLLSKKITADELSKEVALDQLAKMESELTRSTRLIRSLLDFARQSPPAFKEVNINDVIDRALDLAAHSAELQNVRVIKELDPSLPRLMADFSQLQQVCTNLILNAIQAMPEGGRLTLRTSTDSDNQLKLEIQDTGCGISHENMRKLFTPFFTTKGKGVGLGLAVVYGIIQRHHGKIEAQSKEGKGTTFTIHLPLYHEEEV